MTANFTTRIFGSYNPYITDNTKLHQFYISSDYFKSIKQAEQQYISDKWYTMREYFQPEEICEFVDDANKTFLGKWEKEQRKKYYDKNTNKILEQKKSFIL